ncbi:XRE family transcriptional regulator [Apilactobacillus timberlakei]|uniref:helix-turn-helix domain-containing protein n=1 Tax=Apilactobacillus timberlakei TaxID=2008380 RepID=UPI00112BF907|nr:helix-turn-helix transcriptional regulator [Apilactobacillus timberlakei]TPR15039.1 XRE family transcriptional regulator [Apilactobacillus timberlakei]
MKTSNKKKMNDKKSLTIFKNKVSELMSIYNLTEADFNLAIDRNVGYIQHIFSDDYFMPSIDTILKIAYMFEIDYKDLIGKHPYNYFCRELLLPAMFEQKMTIQELSQKTGIRPEMFDLFYKNKRKFPSFNNVKKIAQALNCNHNVWLLALGNYGSKDFKSNRLRT